MRAYIKSELCLAYPFMHQGQPWIVQLDQPSANIDCTPSNEQHVVSVIKQRMPIIPDTGLNDSIHACGLALHPEQHAFVRVLKLVQEVH